MPVIPLCKGKTTLSLSEGNYQLNYTQGITVFWQQREAPSEQRGVLDIKKGLNYIPWILFKTPSTNLYIPQTCIEDGWHTFYLSNATDVLSGTQKLKELIGERRRRYGIKLSRCEIEDMARKDFIVSFP